MRRGARALCLSQRRRVDCERLQTRAGVEHCAVTTAVKFVNQGGGQTKTKAMATSSEAAAALMLTECRNTQDAGVHSTQFTNLKLRKSLSASYKGG